MIIFKLAFRSLMRRKGRMALIGALVSFGTFLIVFGTVFAGSAKTASRSSIIGNFTGDFIVYSEHAKDLPSPFAFNTPLPRIRDATAVEAALSAMPEVAAYAPYAQNYGIIQVAKDGKKIDLPFIFYAVEPAKYLGVFGPQDSGGGSFFGLAPDGSGLAQKGIMVSRHQNEQYLKNYGLELSSGEKVTLLGITEGGVNTVDSRVVGLFSPVHFTSVFDYINFMDSSSYSALYDYSGVKALPPAFDQGLAAAGTNESAIFGLASDPALGSLDVSKLATEPLSGATVIAVKLRDGRSLGSVMAHLAALPGLGVKMASWDRASGYYAQIASGLQAFIYLATALIFLVVALIFMNTLVINVTERTAEIGTMRAIGTEKSFVSALFVAEALIMNLFAALVGMAGALIAILAIGRRGIGLPDIVAQFLYGGGKLPLEASALPFGAALLVVALVSILATLYPVRIATSITPVKAMIER
ncbi:MAG: hypothetical protein M0001_14435 [Treponema sp.]|nr:hypothetical protein [Treponema sp.]